MTHFSLFSPVSNLGCIEFLNRELHVRFLPGARGDVLFRVMLDVPASPDP
jgi:hypothetical protein